MEAGISKKLVVKAWWWEGLRKGTLISNIDIKDVNKYKDIGWLGRKMERDKWDNFDKNPYIWLPMVQSAVLWADFLNWAKKKEGHFSGVPILLNQFTHASFMLLLSSVANIKRKMVRRNGKMYKMVEFVELSNYRAGK